MTRDQNTLHDALEMARCIPPADLPDFLGRLETIRITAFARIKAPDDSASEMLDATEAARRLGISRVTFYHVYRKYSFVKKEGGKLVASASGLARYQQEKRK